MREHETSRHHQIKALMANLGGAQYKYQPRAEGGEIRTAKKRVLKLGSQRENARKDVKDEQINPLGGK